MRRKRQFVLEILPWILVPVMGLAMIDGLILAYGDIWGIAVSLAIMLVTALLILQVGTPDRYNLWCWVLVYIFLTGYFFKTHFILSHWDTRIQWGQEWPQIELPAIIRSIHWILISYFWCCFLCIALLWNRPRAVPRIVASPNITRRLTFWLIVGTTAMSLILAAVQLKLGLGVLGAPVVTLPFRLHTLILRFRGDLLAPIFGTLVWICHTRNWRGLWYLSVLGIAIHGLAGSVASTSRGSLVVVAMLVVFTAMASGRLTKHDQWAAAIAIVGTIVLMPVFSIVRASRVDKVDLRYYKAPTDLATQAALNLQDAGGRLAIRTSGADGLWFWESFGKLDPLASRLEKIAEMGLVEYYTRAIVGVENPEDFRAPGMIAGFIFLGGPVGMLALVGVMLVFGRWIWGIINRWEIAPVAVAVYTSAILNLWGEGTLQFQNFIGAAIALLIVKRLYAMIAHPRRGSARRGDAAAAPWPAMATESTRAHP
ncbi:MAG: hypothetical protein JWN02_2842 [Acidobacteria bacterium]|nr:hypothetical protein [Acidobacteriota bacterium]